jgi:hypothetical protein
VPTPNQTLSLLAFSRVVCSVVACLVLGAACDAPPDLAVARPVPEYHRDTGKLTKLSADRDGDGRLDTWAYMDGLQTSRIEIDRTGDGQPDRWEYYEPAPEGAASPSRIVRAEERASPGARVTRRETYQQGALAGAEEDTDGDGRADKWEYFEAGRLARVDLDTLGKGYPSRRLIYEVGGRVRVETDPEGDGVFVPVMER